MLCVSFTLEGHFLPTSLDDSHNYIVEQGSNLFPFGGIWPVSRGLEADSFEHQLNPMKSLPSETSIETKLFHLEHSLGSKLRGSYSRMSPSIRDPRSSQAVD